ncbi:MAG: glycoside hydrolase [Clostridiales bacterium]|nr:glycoside hydrolase [Clostridiales bacterium]
MSGLHTILGTDGQNTLYPFFWQHGEPHAVLEDYMEKIAASGMKGVCIEARPHPEFVRQGWWDDLDCILAKAKALDMKLWILDDSHFPTGFANGRVKADYPQYLKWYLDLRRYDVQGPMEGARIDFPVLKGRFWEKPDASARILGVYLAKRTTQETVEGDPIDPNTLTDITAQMQPDTRLLTLDVPEGAYSIFVVFLTRKGGEEATKDYLNPLVREATEVLIQEVYEPHYAHYKDEFGKTIQGFFSDEPRFGNAKGTEAAIGTDMVLPWREGLEQELGFAPKFLPLLWVRAGGQESDIRLSYMDTVTRLYNENFTKVLGDWCRGHGVWYLGHTIEDNGAHARLGYGTGHYFRGQQDMDFAGIDTIGGQIVPGMNYHHDAFNTGGSNGEFYHYALAKLASSAAHLDPKKQGRVLCEAFGAYGWNEGLKAMKWIADHLLVRGVNYIVPHAFDPKDFPDFDCPPHFYAHGHNPQFRYFKVFSDYVNRVSSLFREGTHPARVGLFYPAELEWCGACLPVEKPARELTTHQISFDIVSLDYLKAAELEHGGYSINGQRFEVLVLPYGECLPAELVSLLEGLLEQDVRVLVVNQKPARQTGGAIPAAVLEGMEVVPLKELGGALSAYQAVHLAQAQPDLVVGEYARDGKRFYMLFNENIGRAIQTSITFPADGNLYRYDALTDILWEAPRQNGNCLLTLDAYESAVFVVSREPLAARQQPCGAWEQVPLTCGWKVQFADSRSYPTFTEDVPVQSLCCVQTLAGWENRCGTLRFSAQVEVPACSGAGLDLGQVYETAQVFVNGQSAGCRICRPYRFDLTGLLKPGRNELSVEVTNTLGTAVRDGLSHYMVLEPFGVQGPATMQIRK